MWPKLRLSWSDSKWPHAPQTTRNSDTSLLTPVRVVKACVLWEKARRLTAWLSSLNWEPAMFSKQDTLLLRTLLASVTMPFASTARPPQVLPFVSFGRHLTHQRRPPSALLNSSFQIYREISCLELIRVQTFSKDLSVTSNNLTVGLMTSISKACYRRV